MRIDYHKTDENSNSAGGQSCGIGFTIAWQDGPCQNPESPDCVGRNGAFLIEVLEACNARLEHYQSGKFSCAENEDALAHLDVSIGLLKSRLDRRKEAGTLGTHTPD